MMFRKVTPFFVLLILLASMFTLWYQLRPVSAATIYIPDNYSTIQSAINHAFAGDTIIVRANRTQHEDVIVNKTVTLQGENKYTTVIQGVAPSNISTAVVLVTSPNVTVTGFTIKDPTYGHDKAAIALGTSSNCQVSGNIIPGDTYIGIGVGGQFDRIIGNTLTNNGLTVGYTANHNTVLNNTLNGKSIIYLENAANQVVSGTGIGQVILLRSRNITVANLNLSNAVIGIQVRSSNNNKILGNTWTNCYEGISVSNSSYNQISGNRALNGVFGVVLLIRAANNTVSGNNIVANDGDGISIGYLSDFNNISGNNVTGCGLYSIEITDGLYNKIHHNNFMDTPAPMSIYPDNATNFWDDGYPSGGNYWNGVETSDNYKGPFQNQTGSDGISDSPYTVNEYFRDRYPLMGPVGSSTVPTGTDITVFPTLDAALTFDQVTASGAVSGNTIPTGPPPPTGYVMLGQYYDIRLTANYTGNITVRIIYNDIGLTPEKEASLKMRQIDLVPGDTNKDGKVNLVDIFAVALAFGSQPGHPRWNPVCDINGDGKVDLRDYFTTAKNFNKVAVWHDITSSVDTVNNLIYGETSHFSLIGIHAGT